MRKRLRKNSDLPKNLYTNSSGYFSYRHPITGKYHGLGKDRVKAIEAANQLNAEITPKKAQTKISKISRTSKIESDFDDSYCGGNTPWISAGAAKHDWFIVNRAQYVITPKDLASMSRPLNGEDRPNGLNCVYFLFRDSAIVYVGMATNLYDRTIKHDISGKRYDRYAVIEGIPKVYLPEVESFYMHALRPEYNKKYTPCLFDWSEFTPIVAATTNSF